MSRLGKYLTAKPNRDDFYCAGDVEKELRIELPQDFEEKCINQTIKCINCAFNCEVLNQVMQVLDEQIR